MPDEERRNALYKGQLFVYSPSPGSRALCEFARNYLKRLLHRMNLLKLSLRCLQEKYVAVLEVLKPKFIHHPTCKKLIQELLSELGCDLSKTYFDVPRLRTATSDNYLTSGLAYAFHPHRDTWYSAPQCQINWWIPVYDIVPENCMAFHPRYWTQPIKNGSRDYNYYRWNKESRGSAAKQIKTDTRKQPHAEEPMELDPQLRLVCKVGASFSFPGRICTRRYRTLPDIPGLVSTFAPYILTT